MEHYTFVPTNAVKHFDMEPTDAVSKNMMFHQKGFTMFAVYTAAMISADFPPIVEKPKGMVRLRGGVPDPNNDSKHNMIPYLTNIRFTFNGLPCIDFQERVLDPLNNGLGSMNIKGATLLQTAQETDPGGLRGNPSNLTATPAILDEHNQRNMKLYSCIMNYMHPTCEMYFYFARFFPGEGTVIYAIIRATGPLLTPQRIVDARADAWVHMTMDTMKIPYTQMGWWMWIQVVQTTARKLGKDGAAMLTKWIRGLPDFFKHVKPQITQMGATPAFCFPPTYGSLPGHRAATIAANGHPLANQPNIRIAGVFFFPQWCDSIRHVQASNPMGTVRMAELFAVESFGECQESEELDSANMLAENITKKHVCNTCGKPGHTASFYINGTKFTCKDNSVQEQPAASSSVDRYKNRYKEAAKQVTMQQAYSAQLEEKIQMLEIEANKIETRKKFGGYNKKNAYAIEEDDSSGSDEQSSAGAEDIESDANSASSAGSYVPNMANAIHNSKAKGKRPMRR